MEVFKNKEFGEISAIVVNSKEYFDAVECAKSLGYLNTHDAINRHCKKEGMVFHEIGVASGKKRNGEDIIQYVNRKFIDEANLYRLIMKSRLKSAKKFEQWIFNEVIPTIRRCGAYMDENTIDNILNNPSFLNTLMEKLIDEKFKRHEAQKNVIILEANIKENKPYIEFSKAVSECKEAISIGAFAKILNNNNIHIGRNRLYFWFREKGYMIKSGNEKNVPKQRYIDMGLFRVIEQIIQTENGEKLKVTPRITGKGQTYFMKIIEEDYKNSLNDNLNRCN